jgi:hypothetical protein
MVDGRIIVGGSRNAPKVTLIACPVPGCSELLPEKEYLPHSLFHADPVEEEEDQEPLNGGFSEEGVYSVTSLGSDSGS